jgi:hypothetical protein
MRRLESDLARTQTAVTSLRDLLEHPTPPLNIGRRKVDSVRAAAISQVVRVEETLSWFLGASRVRTPISILPTVPWPHTLHVMSWLSRDLCENII